MNYQEMSDNDLLIRYARIIISIYNGNYTDEMFAIEEEVMSRMKKTSPDPVILDKRHIDELNSYFDDDEFGVKMGIYNDPEKGVMVYEVGYEDEGAWVLIVEPNTLSPMEWTVQSLSDDRPKPMTDEDYIVSVVTKRMADEIDKAILNQLETEYLNYGIYVYNVDATEILKRVDEKETSSSDVREEGEICLLWTVCQDPKA